MKGILRLTILLTLLSSDLYGQELLLSETVSSDTLIMSEGPNTKKFSHSYIGLAFAVGPDLPGSRINYGKSFEFTIGQRTKWRVNNFYAIGLDMIYHVNSYSLKQEKDKLLPNDSIHSREKIKFHNIGLGFYNRFNYGKRGNYMGNFVDVGMQFDVPFAASITSKDDLNLAGQNNGRVETTKTTKLRFLTDYNYSGYLRLGFNKVVVTASYRLSDLFRSDPTLFTKYNNGLSKYPELPVLHIGIQMSFY